MGFSVRVHVLASSSSGNSILVASGRSRILIDSGISLRETRARLAACGCELAELQAVLLTHEHTDHCAGLGPLSRAQAVRLFANESTAAGVELAVKGLCATWDVFETGLTFAVGDLQIESFSVSHDAADPVAFVVGDGRHRVGIATDLGVATAVVRRHLMDCDALILEANHDVEMLRLSARPWSLKQRVLGRQGHLSNEQAAALLADVAGPRLQVVYMAHLSSECNTPELAGAALRQALHQLGRDEIVVRETYPDRPAEPLNLGS